MLQLRDKSTSFGQLLAIARELRAMTRAHGALLMVNDRLDLAQLCEADGVHLGPEDCPLSEARKLLGPNIILGASCGTTTEAQQAQKQGADYIGAGAVFGTGTKLDAGSPLGLTVLREIVSSTSLPVAAIGGISAERLPAVMRQGVAMACVISAVTSANSVEGMAQATREMVAIVGQNDPSLACDGAGSGALGGRVA